VRRKHHRKLRDFERQEAATAQAILASSERLARRMRETLDQASESARRAEKEYRENAFAQFWDAVEQLARQLDSFNQVVRQLSYNAQRYYMSAKDRQDTFPSFCIRSEALPNPAPVLAELHRIVRMGQTNFQFAWIWEQRKTREVLIAGFRTLGDAIDNLGSTIEHSMSQLASGVAQLVEEQIRTRETIDTQAREHGRMLDNIQRHRKPPF
jgi:hypothetical protein